MGALGLFLYLGKVFILMFSSKRNLFYNRTDPGCKSQDFKSSLFLLFVCRGSQVVRQAAATR